MKSAVCIRSMKPERNVKFSTFKSSFSTHMDNIFTLRNVFTVNTLFFAARYCLENIGAKRDYHHSFKQTHQYLDKYAYYRALQ